MATRSMHNDCPTARPDMERARVFGLIGGTAAEPRVAYLKKGALVGAAVLKNFGGIDPAKVYRFAATCELHRCAHFDGTQCALAEDLVARLPVVADAPPPCEIRPTCRWHGEQGDAACLRCPQVPTLVPPARERPHRVAMIQAAVDTQPD